MTINVNTSRNEYTATSGQTVFNFTFKIYTATDLNVYVTPAGQECNDVTDLTEGYTVTGVGLEDGGSITLNIGAGANDLVTIASAIPTSRTTDYQSNGDFTPETVNNDIDRAISLIKQVESKADRSLLSSECLQGPKPLTLPRPASGEFVRWKSDLSGLENVSGSAIAEGVIVETDYVKVLDNVAAMVADTSLVVGQTVRTQGYNSAGDGGGNLYNIVAAATGTDDGGSYINLATHQAKGVFADVFNVKLFGAVGDGVTDDTSAIQATIAAAGSYSMIYFPKPSVNYLISTSISPLRGQVLQGDGKYTPTLLGGGSSGVVLCGDGVDTLLREITISDMMIDNTGADAIIVDSSNNFYLKDCKVKASSSNGVSITNSHRTTISDCKIQVGSGAGKWAITALISNALIIKDNIVTGGSAGGSIRAGQSASLTISGNTIETSLEGIWISSTSDTGDGVCNAVTLTGNYIEVCSSPIVIAREFVCNGVVCESNWIGNTVTTGIATRTAAITFGRLQNSTIKNNSIALANSNLEDKFNIYLEVPSGDLENCVVKDNLFSGTAANDYQFLGAYGANASVLRKVGGSNIFDFTSASGAEEHTYISPVFTENVAVPAYQWCTEQCDIGGVVTRVEIIDMEGTFNNDAVLRIGRAGDTDGVLLYTIDEADKITNSKSIIASEAGTASGAYITYPSSSRDDLLRISAGTGTGTFRVKITFKVL